MAKTYSTYPNALDDFSTDRTSGDVITSNSYDVIETALSAIEVKLALGTGLSATVISGTSVYAASGVQSTNIYGSSSVSGDLYLYSTSHATKGKIYFGATNYYDEANDWFLFQNDANFIKQAQPDASVARNTIFFGDVILNEVHDPVIVLGYNYDGLKANHPKFYQVLEGYYYDLTRYWSEWYLERVDSDGFSYRPISVIAYDGHAEASLKVDSFFIYDRDGVALAQFSAATGAYILYSGSSTIALRITGVDPVKDIADIYVGSSGELILNAKNGTRGTSQYIDIYPKGGTNWGVIIRDCTAGSASFGQLYVAANASYMNIVVGAAAGTAGLVITSGHDVGIGDFAPGEKLDVAGNINATGVIKIDDVQVVSNRVIDATIAGAIDSGDVTTDAIIEAMRTAMLTHGLIAAA